MHSTTTPLTRLYTITVRLFEERHDVVIADRRLAGKLLRLTQSRDAAKTEKST